MNPTNEKILYGIITGKKAANDAVEKVFARTTWEDIKRSVKLGFGPVLFPVGTEFTVKKAINDSTNDIIFVVIGHDQHAGWNKYLKHTMTLETKTASSAMQFCETGALYYAENGLSAGAYCFTVKQQNWFSDDNDVVYYFTLQSDIPAGGQIVLDVIYNKTFEGRSVKTYSSNTATTPIESATLSSVSIAGATNLGATDGNSANMNHMHRALLGSNNYAQSAARQWCNGSGTWEPQTIFDRPPAIGSNIGSFADGLQSDFLSSLEYASVPFKTGSTYEINSLDGTEFTKNKIYNLKDKFFLLSRTEIFGSSENNNMPEGELLEYYDGKTAEERIKYNAAGTAVNVWLRTNTGGFVSERDLSTNGTLGSISPSGQANASVACIIG